MTQRMQALLRKLSNSGASAAMVVNEHLLEVANNGPDYATDEFLLAEAQELKAWASMIIGALS